MANNVSENHSSLMYLWLGEHVEAPGAHFAISGNADKVVSVLGSHHVHTVNWVLNTTEHSYQESRGVGDLRFINVCVWTYYGVCITVCAAADRGVL